jgi:DNA transformation protein and related proteins
MDHLQTDLTELSNIGPVSIGWLVQCGITSRSDLEAMGAVMAYKIVKHRVPAASLNLLYGLHAALTGVHWTALSAEIKAQLKAEATLPLKISSGGGSGAF